jgi:hypothetical protein
VAARTVHEGARGPPTDALQSLIDRHGWLGRLALTQGMSDFDRDRRDLLAGLGRVFTIVLALGLLGLAGGLVAALAGGSARRQGMLTSGFERGPAGVEHPPLFVVFTGAFMLDLSASRALFGLGVQATTGAPLVEGTRLWPMATISAVTIAFVLAIGD